MVCIVNHKNELQNIDYSDRTGVHNVAQYVISADAMKKIRSMPIKQQLELKVHFHKALIQTIQKMFPGSVHRAHCDCCYGDGPDIQISGPENQEDGSWVYVGSIDFDFVVPEERCE